MLGSDIFLNYSTVSSVAQNAKLFLKNSIQQSHSNDEDNSEKRVGFVIADDLEDGNSFDDSYKWERKDTPHHLKGKRITSEDPDALQDILSKLSKKKSEEKLDHLDDEVPVKDEDAGKVFSNKVQRFCCLKIRIYIYK